MIARVRTVPAMCATDHERPLSLPKFNGQLQDLGYGARPREHRQCVARNPPAAVTAMVAVVAAICIMTWFTISRIKD